MSSFAKISIRILADLKQFSSQMQNAQRDMQKMGQSLTKVGQGLTLGLTAPIVAIGAISVKTFADFEQSLAKVAAVSGATGNQMAALRANAEDLGATTRFTASEVAGLQLSLSKLGFKPEEIIETTDAVLNLALATGSDLAESATVAASTMRGFGLSVAESGRVTDVMAASFSASALDLEKFSTAMSTLAPVAKNANVSLEEATSYLSILVDRGVDATTAGTGLRNIFLDLAGSGQTLSGAMEQIRNSTNKNKTAFDLFGKRGATVAAIMADNADEAKQLEDAYNKSAGAAKRMAGIMDDTLQGSFYRLKSAMESAAIAIGEELAPMIRSIAEFAATLISKFKDLSSGTKKFIVIVAGLAAALGPLLIAAGFLMTTIIPGLIALMPVLTTAFVAMTGPIGLTVLAVAGLIAVLTSFGKESKDVAKSQNLLTDVTQTATKAIAEEKAQVEALLFTARDEHVSKEQRLLAVKKLNQISPEYLGNLKLETINTDSAREAVEKYNTALIATAKAKAAQAKLVEIQAKIIDKELELSARRKKILDAEAAGFDHIKDNTQALAREKELLKLSTALLNAETEQGTKALEDQLAVLLEIIKVNGGVVAPSGGGGGGGGDGDDKLGLQKLKAEGIAAQQEFDKLQLMLNKDLDLAKSKAEVEAYSGMIDDLNDVFLQVDELPNPFTKLELAAQEFNKNFNQYLSGSLENIGVFFGEFLAGVADGTMGAKDLFAGLLGIVGSFMGQLGKSLIAVGVASEAFKDALVTGWGAIAAGVVLVALAGVVKNNFQAGLGGGGKRTAFANGGIVYGPTNALIGEYSGARNNPEVVAPLDKLKSLLGGGSGGKMDITVKGILKGTDMHLQAVRTEQYLNRRS